MAGPVTAAMLYEALSTELGVIIQCDDPQAAIRKLEALRKESNDPDLSVLTFQLSPVNPGNEVWLVKRSASNAS